MKFKDQVAYICVDCKKGFRIYQLTKVRITGSSRWALKCDSCIKTQAKNLIFNPISKNGNKIPKTPLPTACTGGKKISNLPQAYRYIYGVD